MTVYNKKADELCGMFGATCVYALLGAFLFGLLGWFWACVTSAGVVLVCGWLYYRLYIKAREPAYQDPIITNIHIRRSRR